MNLYRTFAITAAAGFFAATCFAASAQPNIIIILSDDMGFSDLGCYGGEIKTPTLDALAANGVRFTQFYNTGRCCPTRASLLTGLHPHQAGVGHMTNDQGYDGYRGTLSKRCVTIAEALKPAGYRTYMCGKWHVSRADGPDGDKSAWPLQRGFEKFYGTIKGGGSFYDPTGLCRQNTYITPANDPEYKPESFYYTDAISDNAVRFLQQHSEESPGKPFFMYIAYTAAHWPMHAKNEDIAKYQGRYDAGYEAIRAARFARMKELGLVPNTAELSPAPQQWSDVKDKAWEARCMEVYAAMVDSMDQGIGRVVGQLKKDGRFENTLIFFLQDNGGCAEETGRKPNGPAPAGLQPMTPDQLQTRVTPPMQTRDGRWVRTGPGVMPGPADTFIAYGEAWANVSNTPFREYKHYNHEGGISTPLVASWPAGIAPEKRGRLERQPGQLTDLMATCVDVAGAKYPGERLGEAVKPMEGASLRPALTGESITRTKPLVWEHEGNRAIRDGKWKLVAKENKPWELYDIEADRSELHDLGTAHPDKVKTLSAAWDAWAARADVLPLDGWRKKKPGATNSLAKRDFQLKAGDRLEGDDAPAIAGREFTLNARVDIRGEKGGVIIAQGGVAQGYALYLSDGRVKFTVRRNNKATTVTAPQPVSGSVEISAGVKRSGELSLSIPALKVNVVDNAEKSAIPRQPADALEVGRDTGGLVADYGEENAFKGSIESLRLILAE